MKKARMTPERLQHFGEAWARRDIEELMTFITDDCVYSSSIGPEPGATYIGRDAVRAGFEKMLQYDEKAQPHHGRVFISGNRGTAEWSFTCIDESGQTYEVKGCDLFEFAGDKIRRKDAFRKTFPDCQAKLYDC